MTDFERGIAVGRGLSDELTDRFWREDVEGIVQSWRDSSRWVETDFARGLDTGINLVCASIEQLLERRAHRVAS